MFAIRVVDQAQDLSDYATLLTDTRAHVWVASNHGCVCDADLSNPVTGTDDTANLQTLVDIVAAAGGGTILIDKPMKLGGGSPSVPGLGVKLRSGVTIRGLGGSSYGTTFPPSGVIQGPNSLCAIRNFHWTSRYNNGSPVSDFSTIVDHDIAVENLFINGNLGTGGVNNCNGGNGISNPVPVGADPYANPTQLACFPLFFAGVRDLKLKDVWVYDPGDSPLCAAYIDGAELQNCTCVVPNIYANAATPASINPNLGTNGSWKFYTNCRNIRVDNLGGYYDGEVISFAADNSPAGGIQSVYYSLFYPGPVTGVQCTSICPTLSLTAWVLQSGMTDDLNVHYDSLVDQILFDGITGTYCQGLFGLFELTPDFSEYGFIQCSNVSARIVQGPFPFVGDQWEGEVQNFTLSKMNIDVSGVTNWQPQSLGSVTNNTLFVLNGNGESGHSKYRIRFDDVSVYSTSSVSFAIFDPVSTLGQFEFHNCRMVRTQAAAGSIFRRSTASATDGPNAVTMTDCFGDGISNLYLQDAPSVTVGNLTLVGTTHLNAGGGATVQVSGASGILSRLRASGSNTALLAATASGGSITNKKTDATEDS